LSGFRCKFNLDAVFIFLAFQKRVNFKHLEGKVLPTGTRRLRESILIALDKLLEIADCGEQRRFAAAIWAKQQLLPLGFVLEVDEAAEIVKVDPSKLATYYYGEHPVRRAFLGFAVHAHVNSLRQDSSGLKGMIWGPTRISVLATLVLQNIRNGALRLTDKLPRSNSVRSLLTKHPNRGDFTPLTQKVISSLNE
jgi:hypothetical protein